MLQGETCAAQGTEQESLGKDERMLGKLLDCSFYLMNSNPITYFFPELQTPYVHFSFPYKKVDLIWDVRWSFKIHNPPSSQITSHLNKAPIKIQSLSLLIGSGSDKQHEC